MSVEILMPALSPTMEEGTLSKWLVKEGDKVVSGDLIAEIETDKATMEVESVEDGTIGKLLVLEGEEYIKVNAPIAILLFDGDSLPLKLPSKEKKEDEINVQVVSSNKLKEVDLEVNVEFKNEVPPIIKENKSIKKLKRIFSSPLARRIAKLKNIDLTSVLGSGPNGRILKIDIESLSDNNNLKIENSLNINDNFEIVKNTTMRKTIAERLVKSKNEAPHFYLSLDCNIDKLLEIRASINSKSNNDFKISVNDIIIKTVSASLIKVPKANASWENENTKYFKNTDISVAVAINGGLITPIVRDVQSKGLMSISLEMKNLSTKAKEGKLLPEEYVGGSFSISNLGMFGIKEFSAVINPPQGAILAVGAGEQRPVVIDGQISIATIMTVTLSCDHRVVDGAVGAEFLSAFKEYIENPALMLL
ncbi:MAG: pyruvate dehydrogenase complex dihydrolipoamide acetyltransferase [Candidatus Puniceispirillales bacterium]|jgi:pyruvate dehydrogenase E2 component (dihydrolipoamide acetyltransferase)|tara:strand:+ start:1705 stop:2964 length:1260 start_codon:yes stop_codon:yes gene_type:complete